MGKFDNIVYKICVWLVIIVFLSFPVSCMLTKTISHYEPEYKCIDGKVYIELSSDVKVESEQHKGMHCIND